MGKVVQFKRGTAEAGRLGNAAGIDAIQSWLAITIQAVEANATSIVKNITTIETILVSTDDHELRALLLRQLESIHYQLALAADAVRQLEPLAVD
jgi:hypothetical protein